MSIVVKGSTAPFRIQEISSPIIGEQLASLKETEFTAFDTARSFFIFNAAVLFVLGTIELSRGPNCSGPRRTHRKFDGSCRDVFPAETTGCASKAETTGCASKAETRGCASKAETTGCASKAETRGCASKAETTGCASKAETTADRALSVLYHPEL